MLPSSSLDVRLLRNRERDEGKRGGQKSRRSAVVDSVPFLSKLSNVQTKEKKLHRLHHTSHKDEAQRRSLVDPSSTSPPLTSVRIAGGFTTEVERGEGE